MMEASKRGDDDMHTEVSRDSVAWEGSRTRADSAPSEMSRESMEIEASQPAEGNAMIMRTSEMPREWIELEAQQTTEPRDIRPRTPETESQPYRQSPIVDHARSVNSKEEPAAREGSSKPRRFYIRGLGGALLPLAIAAYFFVIWRLYLSPVDSAGALVYGPYGASIIFYTWFVIVALGLNLSQYGLEGIEAGMLQHSHLAAFGTTNARAHRDQSWTGPGGWFRKLFGLFKHQEIRSERGARSISWWLLAVLAMAAYIALPLSGLAMNFGSGYSPTTNNPQVTGFNNTSWNARFQETLTKRAFSDWASAAQPSIPGLGVVYTEPGVDRSAFSFLKNFPNRIPDQDNTPMLFIAPQAQTPISGSSWGLAVSYNCSVVKSISELTILSHRNATAGFSPSGENPYYVLNNSAAVRVYNETNSDTLAAFADNVQAVLEIGYDNANQAQQEQAAPPAASECYFPVPLPGGKFTPYPGLDEPQVLEIVLWQNISSQGLDVSNSPNINASLDSTIPELLGAYKTATSESEQQSFPMAAVGLRCQSVSAVGTADIDGQQATFSNFQRSDTPATTSGAQCARRLSLGVPTLLFAGISPSSSGTTPPQNVDWLRAFYGSVGRPTLSFPSSDDENTGAEIPLQTSLLQAVDLHASVLQAYALYAAELAYNDGLGFLSVDAGSSSSGAYTYMPSNFSNAGAWTYEANTILTAGVVPPALVAALLALWGVGSFVLAVAFSFRRRVYETVALSEDGKEGKEGKEEVGGEEEEREEEEQRGEEGEKGGERDGLRVRQWLQRRWRDGGDRAGGRYVGISPARSRTT